MRRHGLIPILFCASAAASAQDVIRFWYPLQPGDTRVYANEFLQGRIDHPTVDRWTTEETVIATGSVVTLRARVLDGNPGSRQPSEIRYAVRGNCLYTLGSTDPSSAEFCFPMRVRQEWGRTPLTSPAREFVWYVDRLNGDPYGPPGARTFHLSAHISSGDYADRWFTEGIGLVQEVEIHHGTYEETRRRLIRATLAGKTRTYELSPAHITPLTRYDCEGAAWQHYVHADGTPFRTRAECVAAARPGRLR